MKNRRQFVNSQTVDAIIGSQAFQNGLYNICFRLGLDKVETVKFVENLLTICRWSKTHSPNA